MLRNFRVIAIVGMASLIGAPAAMAQTQTFSWGVFRENVPNVPDDQRNCWTQAMVAGETINGELMAERLTQPQAETALLREARRGLCAKQRTSPGWSARDDNGSNSNWSNPNGSNPNGSNPDPGRGRE